MKQFFTYALLIACSSTYAQDIEEGVIGYWNFNQDFDLIDQSATGQDGIILGGAFTTDRFGTDEKAVYFDGFASYGVLQDSLDHVFTAQDAQFSISLWHRTGDVIPNLSPLICKYAHSGCGDMARQWALLIAANEGIRFYFASSPDNMNYRSVSTLDSGVAAEPNTWYHIVVNYDGSLDSNDGQDRVSIYVDNVLQNDTLGFAIGDLGDTINNGNAPIGLMDYVSTSNAACGQYYAPGALDDLRIYDRLLLPSEVELLYLEPETIDTTDTIVDPPGGTGINDQASFSASINVYPTIIDDGQVNITSTKAYEDLQIEIVSIQGIVVQHMAFAQFNGQQVVSVKDLASGNYFVKLSSGDGLQSIKPLIVR